MNIDLGEAIIDIGCWPLSSMEVKWLLKSSCASPPSTVPPKTTKSTSVYHKLLLPDLLPKLLQDPRSPQTIHTSTVSQQRTQPILRFIQMYIVAMTLHYSYVQEYVTVEIFYLALLYFQYPVTGEQSTSSIISVFAKPNHQ